MAETCDNVDNDCDGVVDDGIAPVPTTCGVGACAGNTGQQTCVAGSLVDSCDPLFGASAEVCDGADNDCDGVVDEGGVCGPECIPGADCDTGLLGVCALGITSCSPDVCGQVTGASSELCDGLDNDCDGVVDNAALLVKANKHTVGSGSHPGSTKEPLVGIEACVYDKSDLSCARTVCGGISHQNYQCIIDSCGTDDGEQIFCCTTDGSGECTINAPPGDYVVISDDATKTVLPDPLGVSTGALLCGELKQKHLQQIVKADGKKVSAKTSKRTGSELLVIEPEYIEWTGAQELYPFVFETLGDWALTTSVAPPQGFVADYDSLAEQVTSEIEAVQFTITDVGSDWIPTEVQHVVEHNGRREIIRGRIGVQLAPGLAEAKGVDIFGHPQDESGNPIPEPGFDPRAERPAEIDGWIEPSEADPEWTLKLRVLTTCEGALSITRGQGYVVRLLATGTLEPGEYEFPWDGLDDNGKSLKPGPHFLTLLADEVIEQYVIIEGRGSKGKKGKE